MSILRDKQEKLVQGVAAGKSLAHAHREAGYNGVDDASRRASACEILKQPHVAARLEEVREQAVEQATRSLGLTKEWVLAKLKAQMETCMERRVLGMDKEGHAILGGPVNAAAANSALALIGKELGMFVERKGNEHEPDDIDTLSHERLIDRVNDLHARLKELGVELIH